MNLPTSARESLRRSADPGAALRKLRGRIGFLSIIINNCGDFSILFVIVNSRRPVGATAPEPSYECISAQGWSTWPAGVSEVGGTSSVL